MMRRFSTMIMVMAILVFASAIHADTAVDIALRMQAAIDAGDAPEWMSPRLPQDIQNNVQNKGTGLAARLNLDDEAKEAKVADLLAEHYARVWAWNQQVEEKLNAAWAQWDIARGSGGGEKDELKALTIMIEKIDPVYAEFTPQIHRLLADLRKELTEEQVIALMDRITRSPGVDRTHNAYLAMVPEMTDEEKQIIRSRLEQARVDSLAAWKSGDIVKIFKKYKIRNEFSIDYFGYGYRQRYTDWVNQIR